MSLTQAYQAQIDANNLSYDAAQLHAVAQLDELQRALQNGDPAQSIYLYGPVGRGKTMLMDLFYKELNGVLKERLHFHHFMARVHQELNALQGTENPLVHIAKTWAERARVLCFDEFFVTDIGDAMIMAGLFDALFKEGITLVATSNAHPKELYKNGLARERFAPTISLLMAKCNVLNVAGSVDHRFAHGLHYKHYFVQNNRQLLEAFNAVGGESSPSTITLCNRPVTVLGKSPFGYMFDFMALCSTPRATADYIELARQHSAIYVTKVPKMGAEPDLKQITQGIEDGYKRAHSNSESARFDDEARRFIALVDECYEQRCLLVIDAQSDLYDLYVGKQLAFAFERTKSRLVEMQSWKLNTAQALTCHTPGEKSVLPAKVRP